MFIIEIGPSPTDERAAQVGEPNFTARNIAECRALIGQLKRELGTEPANAELGIKANAHDFGTYREVVCRVYDDADESAVAYAYRCESETPEQWDDEARAELRAAGFEPKGA